MMMVHAVAAAMAAWMHGVSPEPYAAMGVTETQEAMLRFGDAVRVQARALGTGWHEGVVGDVGGCMVVLVPQDREGSRVTSYRPLPIDGLAAVQRRRPARSPGASGERQTWLELPLAQVKRSHGGCGLPGS